MSQEHRRLSLSNLHLLHGGITGKAFDRELQKVLDDLEARPSLATNRKVTLELELKPIVDEAGIFEEIEARVVFNHTLPKSQTKKMPLSARKLKGKQTASFPTPTSGEGADQPS